jgi:hypothetical protein
MLESSGVLDAMMAPVEQVLQRAAAADVNLDALELCDLQQSSRRVSLSVSLSLCVFVSLYLSLSVCHTHTHTHTHTHSHTHTHTIVALHSRR